MSGWRRIFLIIGFLCFWGSGKEAVAEASLQARIDAVPMGGTLKLSKGTYKEALILTRPITIEGQQGTQIEDCSSGPVIKITGKNVSIKGISVKSCTQNGDVPAIFISGSQHRLEKIDILHSDGIGVKAESLMGSVFKDIAISGTGTNNGIDLWNSIENEFRRVKIDHVQDGFYMENSSENSFIDNRITDSRYSIHVMFSDRIRIEKNESKRNITGAMIMGTNQTIIRNNVFSENRKNVNAQGLLLYDVHQSEVRSNLISNNRVGMFLDDSTGNVIAGNQLEGNFIGAQLNKISGNTMEGNLFMRNIAEVQATQSGDNIIQQNYWDAAWKLDSDGDGKSNVSYRADPYFLKLIKNAPEFQLFFQHPGMIIMQKMLKSPDQLLVIDQSPLMESGIKVQARANTDPQDSLMMGITMILGSLLFIFKGRKKI